MGWSFYQFSELVPDQSEQNSFVIVFLCVLGNCCRITRQVPSLLRSSNSTLCSPNHMWVKVDHMTIDKIVSLSSLPQSCTAQFTSGQFIYFSLLSFQTENQSGFVPKNGPYFSILHVTQHCYLNWLTKQKTTHNGWIWVSLTTMNSGGSRIFQMGGAVLSQMGGRTSCFQVKSAWNWKK